MENLFETVALLPMKANSERVKGKNFKDFCGKPLFKWMLDKLLVIPLIDKIVINTDAIDILKNYDCLKNDKIILRQRPKHICGDLVSMNDVIKNDLDNIHANTYLMTHTTNPLLTEKSIHNSVIRYQKGLENGFDSLFSVNKVQTRFYDENYKPLNHDPKNLIRTQDLKPWFEENSSLYIFSKKSFESTNARIGKTPQILITQPFESTDIDTPSDWELAEVLVKYYRQKGILI